MASIDTLFLCSAGQQAWLSKAATRGVLLKKVFLEISQNLQENNCARVSFLIKLQALGQNQGFCSYEIVFIKKTKKTKKQMYVYNLSKIMNH